MRLNAEELILFPMFDDEDQRKSKADFPRDLERLSVQDLKDYIADLHEEIARVEADISRKQASQDAAAAIFKS